MYLSRLEGRKSIIISWHLSISRSHVEISALLETDRNIKQYGKGRQSLATVLATQPELATTMGMGWANNATAACGADLIWRQQATQQTVWNHDRAASTDTQCVHSCSFHVH